MIKDGDFKSKKVKTEILQKGIPMCYRGQVWSALIGNSLKINSHIYQVFKEATGSGSSLIAKDIPRTFPHLNQLFEEVHSLSTTLADILSAF
mmetsp:Transcript_6734/g.10826  ORF Transcript_6734/g.10826 Transcript_6734/m.10826 type:complete len:92 (-) Transcript_6734:702-977(-)